MTDNILVMILICICILVETGEHFFYSLAGKLDRKKVLFIASAATIHLMGLGVWYGLLKLIPIGVAMPMMSLSYVTVALLGKFFFKETINSQRWIAIFLISAGAALIWGDIR